jgi:hypothetical protein
MSNPTGFGGISPYNTGKNIPPLPNGFLKKRPSNLRIDGLSSTFHFPGSCTFSSTSSSVPSPTSPSPSSLASPVRPLHLPHQAACDRAAVPVPIILSSSSSTSQLRLPMDLLCRRLPNDIHMFKAHPIAPICEIIYAVGTNCECQREFQEKTSENDRALAISD